MAAPEDPEGQDGRAATTGRVEWRVSFTMWPHDWPQPREIERITDDENDARDQFKGLRSMVADHDVRPCDVHVWQPKLERRVVRPDEWEEVR